MGSDSVCTGRFGRNRILQNVYYAPDKEPRAHHMRLLPICQRKRRIVSFKEKIITSFWGALEDKEL